MGREKKQLEPEQQAGAPEWMVTFSDCMTLLLTFFVLLLSFSSFSNQTEFFRLKMVFAKQFSFNKQENKEKEALASKKITEEDDDLSKGSEKPTLEKGTGNNLKETTEPANFHDRKVFSISSVNVFYGNGLVISIQGRKTLSDVASFLKEVPCRVVISENGQENDTDSEHLGIQRAWSVIEYFTAERGLEKGQFSIAAENLQQNQQDDFQNNSDRTLEIVLLERSIYN
jgi:chemotaxis protein MotB